MSWICVFCFSIICANCLKWLFLSFFDEKASKKSKRETGNSRLRTTPAVERYSYRMSGGSSYISGAVVMKEDIRYGSYEEYRRNHRIAR